MRTIFVSSTFADMQKERDCFRDVISTQINEVARSFNDHIEFCDLRWGINTEEMDTSIASRKVLDVCLDEIDRSGSPIIILLGNRYGWIPDENSVMSIATRKKMELDDYYKSVTALEAEYGSITKGRRALVYYRNIVAPGQQVPSIFRAEDEKHDALFESLKRLLESQPKCTVKSYSVRFDNGQPNDEDIESFSQMVTEDLLQELKPYWERFMSMTEFEKERERQWAFVNEKSNLFNARYNDMDSILKEIYDGNQVIVCKGGAGSGKSTMASKIATEIKKEQWLVLPFIGGLTNESNDAMDILRNSIYYLEDYIGVEHFSSITANNLTDYSADSIPALSQWQERFKELSGEFEKTGKKLLIIVDAIDQLFPDEIRDTCAFIPFGLSKSIRFLLTSLPDMTLPIHNSYVLKPLTSSDKELVTAGVLRRFGKELSERVMSFLLEMDQASNPHFITMAVQRLCMMDLFDFEEANKSSAAPIIALGDKQIAILSSCPDNLEDMCVELFSEAARRINYELLLDAISYLAVSRYGLRRGDLAALLGERWNELAFSHLINYLFEDFQIRTDGRVDFMHKSIRAGIQKKINDKKRTYEKELIAHLQSLDTHDSVRLTEMPYHLMHYGDYSMYTEYINQFELGESKDGVVIRNAALSTKEYCLSDKGEFIKRCLNESMPFNRLLSVLWFSVNELYNSFGDTYLEKSVIAEILKEAKASVDNRIISGELTGENKEIVQSETWEKLLFVGEMLDEKDKTIIAKEFLNLKTAKLDSRKIEERMLLFIAYYRALYAHKDSKNDEFLKDGVEIAEQGLKLLDDELEKYAIDTDSSIFIPWYYGCLGDTYLHLGCYEKALNVFLKDLDYRKRFYEKCRTPSLLMNLSGGYLNVAGILHHFNTKEHADAEYENYKKGIECFEQAKKQGSQQLMLAHSIRAYYEASQSFLRKTMFAKDDSGRIKVEYKEVEDFLRWSVKAFDYAKEELRSNGDPRLVKILRDICYQIINMQIPSSFKNEFVDISKRWISEDENEIALDENTVNYWVYAHSCVAVATSVYQAKWDDLYDFAIECCNKGIHSFELIMENPEISFDSIITTDFRGDIIDLCNIKLELGLIMTPNSDKPILDDINYWVTYGISHGTFSERVGDSWFKLSKFYDEKNNVSKAISSAENAKLFFQRILEETEHNDVNYSKKLHNKINSVQVLLTRLNEKQRKTEKDYYTALVRTVVKRMPKSIAPKLKETVPTKTIQNAISSYASNVSIDETVAIDDGGIFSHGKKGLLYTSSAMYSSELSKGAFIPYAKVSNVYLNAEELRFVMTNGVERKVDLGVYQNQVYRLFLQIIERRKSKNTF